MAKAIQIETETTSDVKFDAEFETGLQVKMAILHQALHCPGLPAEKTLTPSKIPGLQMSWTKMGLLIKAPTKTGVMKRLGVAQANVGNFEV